MGLWTNNGLTLIATAVQTPSANVAPSFVGISPGCGTIASGIPSGTPITSLPLDAVLPVNLSGSQQLTVTDGTNSETVTTSGPVTAGAASIPIASWTPVHTYVSHVTGVCPTPLVSDTALYNETQRIAVSATSAGGSAGESLIAGYFDSTPPTAIYLLVGWFGGAGATSSVGTGTIMAEDIVLWNHTNNADTFMYQGDGFL